MQALGQDGGEDGRGRELGEKARQVLRGEIGGGDGGFTCREGRFGVWSRLRGRG